MPPFLSNLLSKYGLWLGVAGLAVILLTLAYCAGRGDGKAGEQRKQLEAQVRLEHDASGADATAADQRVKDAVTIEQQRKELDDAINTGESDDDLRARRGCLIMRQQRQPTPPACARFEAGN